MAIDCATIVVTALLLAAGWRLLPNPYIVDLDRIGARKRRNVARTERLVGPRFDYTLPCVLAFLRQRSLKVTASEGI